MKKSNAFNCISFVSWNRLIALSGFCLIVLIADPAWADAADGDSQVITIQAEDYDQGGQNVGYFDKTRGNAGGQYRNDDVDIWRYGSDTYYVGANSAGEWLKYTIDIPLDGYYLLEFRAATPNNNRKVYVEFDGPYKPHTLLWLNKTGGWTRWRGVTTETYVGLSAGRHAMRLVVEEGGLNIDWISLTLLPDVAKVPAPTIKPHGGTFIDSVEVTLASSTTDTVIFYSIDGSDPFLGPTNLQYDGPFILTEDAVVKACASLGGQGILSDVATANFVVEHDSTIKIQAEDYDQGGQQFAYFDKTPGNAGGQYRSDDVDIWRYGSATYYTGANVSGEWLNYTVDIPFDGNYQLNIRSATPNNNRRVHVDFDGGNKTGPLNLPNTGGWTAWRTFSTNVTLSAGRQVMRLAIDIGGMNIDRISLDYIGNDWKWYGHIAIKNRDDLKRLAAYTGVTGNLTIFETNLTSLTALSNLTFVGGMLQISGNYKLTSLEGLNNLTSVGWNFYLNDNINLTSLKELNKLNYVGEWLYIGGNEKLTNIGGLKGLTKAGGLAIGQSNLTNLIGLNNLTFVKKGMRLSGCVNLTSLVGLDGLTFVGGDLYLDNNKKLKSLTGLANLTSVGGPLFIEFNQILTSLEGLNNLSSVGGLYIIGNPSLTSLNVNNLTTVAGDGWIDSNNALTSLAGLNSLTSVDGSLEIFHNNKLANLEGLNNLTSIGNIFSIGENLSLTGLGLDSLGAVGGDFKICRNPMLPLPLAEALRDQVLGLHGIGGIIDIGPDCPY